MTSPVGGVPAVRYAPNGDLQIAYQVLGDGPLDVVLVPGFISHIEYAWHEPRLNRFLRQLSGFARIICFDKRGMGMSDRDVHSLTPTLDQRADDIASVMDAAGSTSAALLGWSEGGPSSIHFAHDHPDRTLALILIATTPRFTADVTFPEGVPLEVMEIFIDTLRSEWGTGVAFELHAPTLANDENARAWWGSFQRLASTPSAVEASLRMHLDVDVRKLLTEITVPTLVVHQTHDMVIPVECGRFLAVHIDGAELLERSGEDHLYWLGNQDETLDAIRSLLARLPGGAAPGSGRRAQRRPRFGWESLTEAELGIVELLTHGLTNRQIGERLYISPRTVQTHVAHVLAKLGLTRRAEVAVAALRRPAKFGSADGSR